MSDCPHDLAERETACADGMCPLCQADEIERLRITETRLRGHVDELKAEITRLTKAVAELDDITTAHDRVVCKNNELRARLTAALQKIADMDPWEQSGPDVARAALEGK